MAGRLNTVHCYMSLQPSGILSDLEIIRKETNNATTRKLAQCFLLRVLLNQWSFTKDIGGMEERRRVG